MGNFARMSLIFVSASWKIRLSLVQEQNVNKKLILLALCSSLNHRHLYSLYTSFNYLSGL